MGKEMYQPTLTPGGASNEKFLILVRHAESKLNATRKEVLSKPLTLFRKGFAYCIDPGVKDAPLTHEGQRQAQRAGRRLARDIMAGNLPPIEAAGVSPLRRTLHTLRLLSDAADTEVERKSGRIRRYHGDWWLRPLVQTPSQLPRPSLLFPLRLQHPKHVPHIQIQPTTTRLLFVVPYLRERKTTSADQPCVKPSQAIDFWKSRPVHVQILNNQDLPAGTADNVCNAKASTPARLDHIFTVGLTKKCRKVKCESVDSVLRRILMLEAWVSSRPEKVLMLVGHNMIFKAWQKYWHSAKQVQWASYGDVLAARRGEKRYRKVEDPYCCDVGPSHEDENTNTASTTSSSWSKDDDCGGSRNSACSLACCEFERIMKSHDINSSLKIYDCPNTGFILVRWRSSDVPSTAPVASSAATSSYVPLTYI
eukprot:Blabericola_migrator_1__9858@NODE_542_length_7732_cov_201_153033_g409_i0_p2_GENE_NODE_542_length_7732_cov_201_153033_g409_i0NODE_542_length_7732_cov_201_153033_g409_i0_p2_ORF_typecomplete_len422_score36_14His_Phos_1/PF00300_22/1_5e13His_Phos_1/PF00300_22/3_6His_Phos_2/PF00328_22/0_076_NODE_542_length_7732_cov_201_153033_g409_i052006465